MSVCEHCSTPFSAASELEKFCCRGCEFVYDLIHHEGMGRFYDLRSNSSIRPVRSVPFEARDFAWLEEMKVGIEEKATAGEGVEADFSLEGMSCVGCVWLVENIFQRQPGAIEASAHPATGLLRLRWAAGEADISSFADEIASFGYSLTPRKAGMQHSEARQLIAKLGLCGAFALNAMVFTLPRYFGMPEDFAFAGIFQLVTFLSATLAMLTGGTYFIRRAWRATLARTPHIDLPIALGIVFAFLGSIAGWALGIEGLMYFDFVATFIFLMLGGRYLQLAAVEKNRNRLQRRRPVPETMKSPDRAEPLPLSEIIPGLRVNILPGQSVPVASTLDSEAAEFSLEWINGEADPQAFRAGRPVPAGAIHLGAKPVTITASETWEQSLLARLTSTDRVAGRIPALEKLLRSYLIAIVLIGIAGFIFWSSTAGLAPALQVMISVFVVSCPCALGVALPFADELAGSRMERAGVFIREPLIWTRLRAVRKIIFDKTGTLTLERPVLTNPQAITDLSEDARLALAQLTSGSLHPVSRSLLEALGMKGRNILRNAPAAEIADTPGMGRSGGDWSLGRPGWAAGNPEPAAQHDAELCHKGEPVARFRFEETLRPDAAASLAALKHQNHRLIILSGDRQGKVAAAAALLEIDPADAHSALQPAEKESIVREIDRSDTLYLGDGANDSLAFNAAWVTGTPVVDRSLLESKSDFYFLGQGLRFLPEMLFLSKRRQFIVRTAFAFALIYNAVAITFALLGHMNPLVAAIIMPLSSAISLAIVALGLRQP
ncbi:MAG: heavy metal translocating P-type ATPase metal-binding domain-containing protein [Luteolibacter sp.]